MKTVRIIPRLDIKGPNLVKGIHLEGLRKVGDPAMFATKYYKGGIDEISYQDIVASLYNRNSIKGLVSTTA
jgi:cyclase